MNVDKLQAPQLFQELKKYHKYSGKTNKQIENMLKSSSVYVLRPELKALQSQAVLPELPMDVVPLIASHLPATKARSLNRQYRIDNQRRFIVEFVMRHFTKLDFENHEDIKKYFNTYNDFNRYQQSYVELLKNDDVLFLHQCIDKITHHMLLSMDKEGMEPVMVSTFIFLENNIYFINDYDYHYTKKTTLPKNKKITLTSSQNSIYQFIYKNFDDYDFERFVDYNNHNPFPTRDDLMLYQKQRSSLLSQDDIVFLNDCRKKLKSLRLGSDKGRFVGFDADGFMFLYDRFVIFNER